MIANVIVDVKSQNTDLAFSYLVPEKYENFISPGIRVSVPFGNGNRLLQGFVISLEEGTKENLKEIVALLDVEPVLNEELLALGQYMQKTTFSFYITCLLTMLPSVFKSEYKKEFWPQEDLAIFQGRPFLTLEEAEKENLLPQLAKLKKENRVQIVYQVIKKDQVKTRRMVESLLNFQEAQKNKKQQRKNALKRMELLERLGHLTAPIPVSDFYELGFSASLLKEAEKLGWLTFSKKEVYRDPFGDKNFKRDVPLTLTEEQQVAFEKINESRVKKDNDIFLLEGITGSGKTEVYLQVIQEALNNKQTALMLVPEIALTPQMVTRFKRRFGEAVAVLHSGLSVGERYDQWRKIQRNEAQVVVGARSAIFAPLNHLGVIIIDEEHETSYKQSENPRYHARELAFWRGKFHHCPVVLGSATPSLESRARGQKNVYTLLTLKNRPKEKVLPEVSIVDLKKEYQEGNFSDFSKNLKEKIQDRLNKKEQTVLLLNRRGYSSFLLCRDCGEVLQCPNCDISLTLHMDIKKMKCHYCGHEENIPKECPKCHSKKIRYYGTGTQKVEEELQQLFPEARILRMDVDTTRKKGAHEKILEKFENHEADILLGTQMIAKGLDYPLVTLVGVLNADTALNLPDFRSSEHTFQLLTQVAGRAGRGELKGEVLIQSFNPEHYAILFAKKHNYEGFYQKEMQLRHLGGYPPYYYTVQLTASHEVEEVACQTIFDFYHLLKDKLSKNAIFLGPSPKAILRVKRKYYYQLLIKYKKEEHLNELLHEIQLLTQEKPYEKVQVAIDVEPLQFM